MTLEDRIRGELEAEATSLTVRPGSIEGVMQRAERWTVTIRLAYGLAAALVVVVAVAVLTSPDPTGPVAGPDGSTVSTVTESSVVETTVTSAPPQTEPHPVAVATADGVVLIDDGEVVERLDIGPVMLAIPDGRGGFVIQIGQSASSILWLSAPGADLVEVVPAEPGVVLRLHEFTVAAGEPGVLYTARRSGPGLPPEGVAEELRLLALDTREVTDLGRVGGPESTVLRVSQAGGRFVASMDAQGLTWFEVVAGPRDGFVNPRTEDQASEDFLVWVGHGVQTADGTTMAFLRGSPRSEAPFRFVVVDVSTGAELMAVPIEGAHSTTVTRLEWDGRTGIVSLSGRSAVVVTDGAVVGTLPVEGEAAWAG